MPQTPADAALVPAAGGSRGELAALPSSARRLAQASVSPHTRRAYAGALRRLDAWLAGRELDDGRLAAYLAELFEAGRAASSAAMAVAAARLRAKLAGDPDPAGPATGRVLAGFRRRSADRGRGQVAPCSAANLAAIFARAGRARRAGRGLESAERAEARAAVDRVIAGLLFMAGLRRSEVAALEWRDVTDARGDDGLLIAVRRSKTNPDSETADVRFVKGDVASAVRALREWHGDVDPADRVVGLSAQAISERFAAAARAAGIEARLTAHSGRVGLASELTARGASAHDVMRAGNWKTVRMVAHYSAGASAERGAVARYL